MKEKIEKVIAEKIRPALQADGGGIELVDVVGNTVKVRLTGACHGCPSAAMTLQHGVTRMLKQEIPEIEEVVAV
jgi:Fe-S cluster biogenesis protein NfuA